MIESESTFDLRRYGRTDLSVSALCVGTSGWTALEAPGATAVLDAAARSGINFVDTSNIYAAGRAEQLLGAVLPGREFVLQTKLDRDVETGDFGAAQMEISLRESLQRLGRESVPVLMLHDPENIGFDAAMAPGGPVEALVAMRDRGVAQSIGISGGPAPMLRQFVETDLFDTLITHNRFTLLDQSALPELLPACEARGISLVIGGLLNSGILADPAPGARFDYQAAPEAVLARAQGIRDVCRRHQVPLLAAAMQFPLAHPRVASILAGVRRPAHLDDYPAGMRLPIPDALWDDLRSGGLIAPSAPTPATAG